MTPARLLAHFDRLADAPDAVPRLRQFVLELAVRGKLVNRSESDGTVAELLQAVEAEKKKLVAAGTLKKAEKAPVVTPDEAWFKAPGSWEWVRLGTIAQVLMGHSPPGDTYNRSGEGLPLINGPVEFTEGPFGRTVVNQYTTSPTAICESGDLLLCVRGSTTGRTNIASLRACIGRGVAAIRPYFQGHYVRLFIWRLRASIIAMGRGIAFPSVSRQQLENLPIPLPPLAEQRRIVEKVDELMALCDQLDAAQAEREERRDRLAGAALARLNQPADDATAFRDHARFALDHLPRLTARPEHVPQLRQTILNLAVRGKLVPQDPTDEPAEVVLSRELSLPHGYQRRRKILKKTAILAPDDSSPTLPNGWGQASVQDLYDINAIVDYADGNHGSLYPRSSEFGEDGIPFVSAKDLVAGRVVWATCSKLNSARANQLTKGWAEGGDVLLTHNATVGRVALVEQGSERFLLGTSVTYYRVNPAALDATFFYYQLQSPLWQNQLEAIMAQTTRNQVSIQKQAFFRVVIPPLAEQRRIVARVDELMAMCNQLDAHLTTAQADRGRLLDAVLHDALHER